MALNIDQISSALGQKSTNLREPKSTVVRFGPKADKLGRDRFVR
jgi:hypothetical protein